MTAAEKMRNAVFRFNGTSCPGIMPRRLAILSLIQTVRPTTMRDDMATYVHMKIRYPIA